MSHHNKEFYPDHNTDEIRAELALHGMVIDRPSMLSDAFRFGWMAGLENKSKASLIEGLERTLSLNLSNAPDVRKALSALKETT